MDKVIFQILGCEAGRQIGIATLNVEKALNALDLEMVQLLTTQLKIWQTDNKIACVVLEGSGEKAFCAGGDVRAIVQASKKQPGKIAPEAQAFFTQEYQLDYLIHRFGKPVMIWGDGIVMGGGLGLMAGGSHRVVTQNSRIAMPEVTIGLYPDVGGSYFLNRMPEKMGLFLGLTGYNMNAADAVFVGLADYAIDVANKEPIWDAMAKVHWQDDSGTSHQLLSSLLQKLTDVELVKASRLEAEHALIEQIMSGDLKDIYQHFEQLQPEQKWLDRAKQAFLAGSPLSWTLVAAQMQLDKRLSLADCFRQELGWSVNCCAYGDFCEGVRALLLDKDKNPQWQFAALDEITEKAKDKLMLSPWSKEDHPLKDL